MGHFERKFQVEEDIARQSLLVSENSIDYLFMWCKNVCCISAVCSFVSSQSARVTDRQTDGQTDGRTDRQNYDPQDRASIAASRGKKQSLNTSIIESHVETATIKTVNIFSYINYSLDNQNNILCYRRFGFTSEVFIRTDFR